MKNKIVIGLVILIFIFVFFISNKTTDINTDVQNLGLNKDSRNGTYIIDGRAITLKNGYSEEQSPNSAAKIITRYFGNEVVGDFNKDGLGDTAFLITTDNGGSGLFYYAVVNLGAAGGFTSIDAAFIGDRISPQRTYLSPNDSSHFVVAYADRLPGQAMTDYPTVGKSIVFAVINGQLGQVVEDFEGEVDINRLNLTMKKWQWVETIYSDSYGVKPKKPEEFYLDFNTNGKISVNTDCNNGFGTYSADNSKKSLNFGPIATTLMFCVDSQESDFVSDLSKVESYEFTKKAELILKLKEGGSIILK